MKIVKSKPEMTLRVKTLFLSNSGITLFFKTIIASFYFNVLTKLNSSSVTAKIFFKQTIFRHIVLYYYFYQILSSFEPYLVILDLSTEQFKKNFQLLNVLTISSNNFKSWPG